ncbi:MAG: sigma-70 family RNA polymerase sigma factor [Acidobacteria bacterium]|nr:sigma-70 family RNA polymerase sigma factor [Acidobacteriota bacterium]
MDERELLQRTRDGDHSAFKILVETHKHQVAAAVFGILGNSPEVDDIGQETFIKFYQNLNVFRGESGIGTYLVRIAINLSLNELRRKKRRKQKDFFEGDPGIERISDNNPGPEHTDEKKIVRSALQKLKPEDRMVIVLRLLNGYTTEETADILRLPMGTVLSRLARAQQKLKKILTPLTGGP